MANQEKLSAGHALLREADGFLVQASVPKLAEAAKKRAEQRLNAPAMEMDAERARVALLKSLVRLQVASRARIRS